MSERLLFVVNNLSFFISHRLAIGVEALAAGYDVAIACPQSAEEQTVTDMGIKVFRVPISQKDHSLLGQFRFLASVYKICRDFRPDICHMITLKTFLVAGVATRMAGVRRRVGSVSGLGYFFMSTSRRMVIVRTLFSPIFRYAMGPASCVIFQNEDDRQILSTYAGISTENTEMIGGSGVDMNAFQYRQEPAEEPKNVVLISRMLYDKGVVEFVNAAAQLKARGVDANFVLAGLPDDTNPASLSNSDLESWTEQGAVNWIGYCQDVNELIANSHIVVLPSYREGFPKVLIEAAANGRAAIATDVPGCRDAVQNGETGILVPVRDADALAAAINILLEDKDRRQKMGQNARNLALKSYSIADVVGQHMQIYRTV